MPISKVASIGGVFADKLFYPRKDGSFVCEYFKVSEWSEIDCNYNLFDSGAVKRISFGNACRGSCDSTTLIRFSTLNRDTTDEFEGDVIITIGDS